MIVGNRKYEPHYDKRHGFFFIWLQSAGQRKYFGLGTDKAEAEKRLCDLLAKRSRGELFRPTETTAQVHDGFQDIAVRELCHLCLEWYEKRGAPGTYKLYRHYAKQFLEYLDTTGKKIDWVSDIDVELLDDYYSWAKSQRKNSPNGGNHHLRHLKSIIRWGCRRGKCDMPVPLFPAIKTKKSKNRFIEEEDLKKVLAVLRPELADMLLFDLLTGLRPQELRPLTRDCIHKDASGYSIHIVNSKASDLTNDPEPRDIPLSNEALHILNRQIERRPDSPCIFMSQRGKPYTSRNLLREFKNSCEKAGIAPKTIYGMRHAFATANCGLQTNMSVIQNLLGHAKISTTAIYTRHNTQYHRSAVEAVAKHFKKVLNGDGENDDGTDREV